MQTLANAAGSTDIQTEVNRRGAAALRGYFDATQEASSSEASAAAAAGVPSKDRQGVDAAAVAGWLSKLDELVEAEAREKSKLVRLALHF